MAHLLSWRPPRLSSLSSRYGPGVRSRLPCEPRGEKACPYWSCPLQPSGRLPASAVLRFLRQSAGWTGGFPRRHHVAPLFLQVSRVARERLERSRPAEPNWTRRSPGKLVAAAWGRQRRQGPPRPQYKQEPTRFDARAKVQLGWRHRPHAEVLDCV